MRIKNISLLSQLVSTLDDIYPKFELAYNNKDIEKFKIIKEEILKINKKITEKMK